MSSPAWTHNLDAVVVGAGGAGLYAALELKKDLGPDARVGVISKIHPSRSHTGAAPGGVCAGLAGPQGGGEGRAGRGERGLN
jgi:succinate dehydrogenase/fumarate reductase flavoprotein subunit